MKIYIILVFSSLVYSKVSAQNNWVVKDSMLYTNGALCTQFRSEIVCSEKLILEQPVDIAVMVLNQEETSGDDGLDDQLVFTQTLADSWKLFYTVTTEIDRSGSSIIPRKIWSVGVDIGTITVIIMEYQGGWSTVEITLPKH